MAGQRLEYWRAWGYTLASRSNTGVCLIIMRRYADNAKDNTPRMANASSGGGGQQMFFGTLKCCKPSTWPPRWPQGTCWITCRASSSLLAAGLVVVAAVVVAVVAAYKAIFGWHWATESVIVVNRPTVTRIHTYSSFPTYVRACLCTYYICVCVYVCMCACKRTWCVCRACQRKRRRLRNTHKKLVSSRQMAILRVSIVAVVAGNGKKDYVRLCKTNATHIRVCMHVCASVKSTVAIRKISTMKNFHQK